MAVSPLPEPADGSRGCCAGGQCCSDAARPRSAPLPRRGCRRLTVEQLVAQRTIEALVVAILPRRAWWNVEGLHANLPKPFLNRGSDELAAVIRPDVRGRTPRDEQVGKRRQHVFVAELARDDQRQALPAGLLDDGEDAELAPVVRPRFDEVVRPARWPSGSGSMAGT